MGGFLGCVSRRWGLAKIALNFRSSVRLRWHRVLAISAFSLAFGALALAQTAGAPARPLITQAVNDGNLLTLSGNTRPEAQNAANDRGSVADASADETHDAAIAAAAGTGTGSRAIDQLHDPQSPNYHHWLSATDFGPQFGPAASDIASITGWLEEHGFTVNMVYPNGIVIDFSGTAGQVRNAFHTEIHHLSVNGVPTSPI